MEEKKEKIVIIILIILCVMLWFIKSYFSTQLYINSIKDVNLDKKVVLLRSQNMELKNELLYLKSYIYITQQAQKQGFVPAQFVYLQ